jgi:hypothetical protein
MQSLPVLGPAVGPIVLNHVDPQCKNPHSKPHVQRRLQISSYLPKEIKAKALRDDYIKRAGYDLRPDT